MSKNPKKSDSAADAFGNPLRPGDKVIWMSPVTNSMELTTVKSIVNKSIVRCYIFADELGNPTDDYARGIATWKICGAKSFPKRNSNTPAV